MKRTELIDALGNHGTLRDQIAVPGANYLVYDVELPDCPGSNAVLFDISPGVSTEIEEIIAPINLQILTLHGIGRVILHDRITGSTSQRPLTVADLPIVIGHGQVYAYQSREDLLLLDTCTPPFQEGDEIEPDPVSLPAAFVAAHRGGYSVALK